MTDRRHENPRPNTNGPGPIGLHGGGEHRQGTEAIERALLDHVGAERPLVAVVPVASFRRKLGPVVALARRHWARVGATVQIVIPDGNGSHAALEAVAGADVIVLTGGVPSRLHAALHASPVWDLILERWRAGAGLLGASAGAMNLFARRLRLYPPNPLALTAGLGPFDGWVVAPHFNQLLAQRWGRPVSRVFGPIGVLGLDEAAAVVGREGRFDVVGNGRVTLLERGKMVALPSGAGLELDLGLAPFA